ncbi:MAG: orotidine-5'-phosphate decarboxylase [Candidatus Dormibacteria bacterium]
MTGATRTGPVTGFTGALEASCATRDSRLCVGLDPDLDALPSGFERSPDDVLRFVTSIIEATAQFAAAFKPNSAFYEAMGPAGMEVLQAVIASVPAGIPVVLDAKRGDLANTAERYATACFDVLGATAVTLSPYLGGDSLQPFLERPDRGVFILCRTSNPGADDLQELAVDSGPLYLEVARRCRGWNVKGNVGLVAGATRPADLAAVRRECPGMPLLVPGVGAQGGDLSAASLAAAGDGRDQPFLINASRAIAGAGRDIHFQHAAAEAADNLRQEINQALAG